MVIVEFGVRIILFLVRIKLENYTSQLILDYGLDVSQLTPRNKRLVSSVMKNYWHSASMAQMICCQCQ